VSASRRSAIMLVAASCCFAAARADAGAFLLEARTEAQAYQIRSYRDSDAGNPVLLPRRRIVQSFGINGYELVTGQDFNFESNLRVYADFGLPRGEAARVDGLHAEDADLLSANVQYRAFGFEGRLGRQVYTDVMDLLAFDGVQLRYTTAFGLGAEVYAGLWVKGASFLGASTSQLDGTRESDSRRLAAGIPGANAVLDGIEPLVGAKVFVKGLAGFDAALGYRRAFLAGQTTFERAAVECRYGQGRGFNGQAGAELDLFLLRLSQLRAELRYDGDVVAVSGEVLRLSPVLSADSIWYYFVSAPRDEANLRVDVLPPGPLRFYLRLTGTRYNLEINPKLDLYASAVDPSLSSGLSLGGSAGASLRLGRMRSALDVTYRRGAQARQLWIDATWGYTPEQGRYTFDARLSVAEVRDGFNPFLRGTFYGAQGWASYLLTPSARASLVLEGNSNPINALEAKVFLLVDLKANL